MPDRAAPHPEAALTRRQLREAERAHETAPTRRQLREAERAHETAPTRRQLREAERAREANSSSMGTADAGPGELGIDPMVDTSATQPGSVAATPTKSRFDEPVRNRSRRQPHRSAARRPGQRRSGNVAPRAAVLTALGALTIATPVLGLDGMDHSARARTSEVGAAVAAAQISVLDALSSSAAAGTPPSMLADPTAASRAEALQASRAAERGALDGVTTAGSDGTLAAAAPVAPRIVMPLAQGSFRKTSSYGGRADPFTGAPSSHTGVDLAAPMGSPIFAVADGVVDYVGGARDGRSGMIIVVKHEIDGQTFYSWYNHMYRNDLYVQVGQQVQAGDVIAAVGSNGRSTGPHLHLEIHTDDQLTTTDPLAWLRERGAVDASEIGLS